jgi:hypothetical protein
MKMQEIPARKISLKADSYSCGERIGKKRQDAGGGRNS